MGRFHFSKRHLQSFVSNYFFCPLPGFVTCQNMGRHPFNEASGKVHNYVRLTSLVAEVTSNKIKVIGVTIYIVPDLSIEQGTLDAHKKETHCCILGIMFQSEHANLLKGD
jgi:hypothetical protein